MTTRIGSGVWRFSQQPYQKYWLESAKLEPVPPPPEEQKRPEPVSPPGPVRLKQEPVLVPLLVEWKPVVVVASVSSKKPKE